ncbi:MAG: TetR/AcrR family transcriptional regulator, partial [Thermodesulfobacteriota bacterium]|nr:TetR/AcrR family transcriptional regulator [Thermodesulfobacteriota bacterium]
RKDPESMKGKILAVARRMFGEYGFHGTTMRMLAKEVGIDISTLHYHWGEKKDLYEAVIIDINNDLRNELIEVEAVIHGRPLKERVAIGIDMMTDYLFDHPEISNLVLFRYFGKTRHDLLMDFRVPEFTIDIVRSMGLKQDKEGLAFSMASILTVMNSIHGFISGEDFFCPMVKMKRKDYIALVKKTLKYIYVAAFTQDEMGNYQLVAKL